MSNRAHAKHGVVTNSNDGDLVGNVIEKCQKESNIESLTFPNFLVHESKKINYEKLTNCYMHLIVLVVLKKIILFSTLAFNVLDVDKKAVLI